MQLSNTQITALLTEVASQEDGFNELLRMSFEALMKAERREHLIQSTEDKGNGFRQVRAYGRGKMLELRVPRTRDGNFYPLLMSVLRDQEEECRKIAFELYGAGLTTAQVGGLFEKLYGRHYSKSSVSRMFDYAREEVMGWLERPLDEYYPMIIIDATFWSTRRGGDVSKEAYFTVLGVKSDRTREVLAIINFPTESAFSWEEVLRGLRKRGVKRLGLVIADGLTGLEEAVARVFSGVPFQKCVVHLQRNVLSRIKPADKKSVGEDLREVFITDKKDDSPDKGWKRWEDFVNTWKKRYPALKNYLDKNNYYAYFTYLNYHHKTRSMLYSTNWVERLNRDYKRTLRMRGVMPDSESVIFLLGKVSMSKTAYDRKMPKLDYEQKRFDWAENDSG
jgi:transposase-like protein